MVGQKVSACEDWRVYETPNTKHQTPNPHRVAGLPPMAFQCLYLGEHSPAPLPAAPRPNYWARAAGGAPHFADRCQANIARIRQSKIYYGLGFHVKVPLIFEVVPSSPPGGGRFGPAWRGSHRLAILALRRVLRAVWGPFSSECGTQKTVKARFWPWLSDKRP